MFVGLDFAHFGQLAVGHLIFRGETKYFEREMIVASEQDVRDDTPVPIGSIGKGRARQRRINMRHKSKEQRMRLRLRASNYCYSFLDPVSRFQRQHAGHSSANSFDPKAATNSKLEV
jgi:hypothetical protein